MITIGRQGSDATGENQRTVIECDEADIAGRR